MASRAEELRKLAARVTTAAGDTSAVSGTSISEILDFMRTNLNIVDGKLKVSAIKGLPVNLLSAPIIVQDTTNTYTETLDYLTIEADKSYIFEGYYTDITTGKTYTFNKETTAVSEMGGCAMSIRDFHEDYVESLSDGFGISISLTMYNSNGVTFSISDISQTGPANVNRIQPIVLEKMYEVEIVNDVNLLSAPIIIQDTTVKYENNFDFVLTSGKTCTLEGYYTTKTGETYTFKHSVVPTDEIGARSVSFQDTPVYGNFDLGVRITLFSKDEGYTTVTIRDNSYTGTYVNYIEVTSITEA